MGTCDMDFPIPKAVQSNYRMTELNTPLPAVEYTPSKILADLSSALELKDRAQIEKNFLLAKQMDLSPSSYGVVKQADKFLNMINTLKKASKIHDLKTLEKALSMASYFKYEDNMVSRCRTLSDSISSLNHRALDALKRMEPKEMERIIEEASQLEYINEDIIRISDVLNHTSKEKLLQLQMKAAVNERDTNRITSLTIQLKDLFFERMGDMFLFRKCPRLRSPSDFANSKFLASSTEKDQIALDFYKHTNNAIHTSLTSPSNPPHGFLKEAKRMFKMIQMYMGDRQCDEIPLEVAKSIVTKGITTEIIRAEIYAQLVKQLTNNPNPSSKERGWELILMCLECFPPGSDMENYLENWLRTNAPNPSLILEALHNTLFEGAKRAVPSNSELEKCLKRKPSLPKQTKTESQTPKPVPPSPKTYWRSTMDPKIKRAVCFEYNYVSHFSTFTMLYPGKHHGCARRISNQICHLRRHHHTIYSMI